LINAEPHFTPTFDELGGRVWGLTNPFVGPQSDTNLNPQPTAPIRICFRGRLKLNRFDQWPGASQQRTRGFDASDYDILRFVN
jgi:hypothetical protein